jgi:NADH-quinone oxidoreductase subunit C
VLIEVTEQSGAEQSCAEQAWEQAIKGAHADGFTFFDLLTVVERDAAFDVVAHLYRPSDGRDRWVACRVPIEDAHLPSCTGVYRAAAWHEREAREMFGIRFTGADASAEEPLLLRELAVDRPLRKSVLLDARQQRAWPGEAEAGGRRSRRRLRPPGVPEGEGR